MSSPLGNQTAVAHDGAPSAGRHVPSWVRWPIEDTVEPSPLVECADEEVQRWNHEWLQYLGREWGKQLAPHHDYVGRPALPDDPLELLGLTVSGAGALELYCDRAAIEGRRVMEMGCGCGNLGKLIARYTKSYLGVDYSTLALKVARLVSPENCTYVHVKDQAAQAAFHGRIDTVVGRYFWIHQNHRLGRFTLEFLQHFLVSGGRAYADFYWPDPDVEQGLVLLPEDPLSRAYPSATFKYSREDIERLIAGLPYRIIREVTHPSTQRRYVVLERQ